MLDELDDPPDRAPGFIRLPTLVGYTERYAEHVGIEQRA